MNVFEFAANVEASFELSLFNNFNEPGYQRKTTWASDLAIALYCEEFMNDTDAINTDAIKKTVEDCKTNWKGDYTNTSEMVAALNFICWWCWDSKDERIHKYSDLFDDLYHEMQDYAYNTLTREDFHRMCRFLD